MIYDWVRQKSKLAGEVRCQSGNWMPASGGGVDSADGDRRLGLVEGATKTRGTCDWAWWKEGRVQIGLTKDRRIADRVHNHIREGRDRGGW